MNSFIALKFLAYLASPMGVFVAGLVVSAVLAVLPGCWHFAYLEVPELVHEQIATFLGSGKRVR